MKKGFLAFACFLIAGPALAANNYKCTGTEPFWGVDVSGDSVKISAPGETDINLKISERLYPQGMPSSYGEAIIAQDPKNSMHMTIRNDGKCSDGMSDKLYSHEAWVTLNSKLLVGCCDQL